jgi:hypothetical protein
MGEKLKGEQTALEKGTELHHKRVTSYSLSFPAAEAKFFVGLEYQISLF